MRITLKLLGPYAEVAIISIIISRASRNGIILVVEQAVSSKECSFLPNCSQKTVVNFTSSVGNGTF